MEKKTQGQIARERTIAGEEFSALPNDRNNGAVFSKFAAMPAEIGAEDVFNKPEADKAEANARVVIVERRVKRTFVRPVRRTPNEP